MILNVCEINLINLNLGNLVVGVTSGCFDLLHYYHLIYLEKCKAECDFLIVGVDSDQLLTHFKAKNATIPEHHRVAMVAALKCVDAAFIMRNLKDLERAINGSLCHKLFKNKPELYGKPIVMGDVKPELVVIPDVNEVTSTTEIVRRIRRRKQ